MLSYHLGIPLPLLPVLGTIFFLLGCFVSLGMSAFYLVLLYLALSCLTVISWRPECFWRVNVIAWIWRTREVWVSWEAWEKDELWLGILDERKIYCHKNKTQITNTEKESEKALFIIYWNMSLYSKYENKCRGSP